MKKIILIGCPGSGKSTMVFKMKKILNYPVLHLDKIYHIDNEHRITREELKEKVSEFAKSNEKWIIDGNYISTIEQRIKLADTIILLDIDTDICIANALKRTTMTKREDMAEGFDNSKINVDFFETIKNFKQEKLPQILNLLEYYKNQKQIIIIKNYEQLDSFLEQLKLQNK